MNEREISVGTIHKALIGGIGGLCLVLLKLIEHKFYIGLLTTNIALAAYLTYISYILLGMIVAAYFTDHDLPKEKCKRHALMMGLLAPSILIAIVSKPANLQDHDLIVNSIPLITSLFFSSAYAQKKTKSKQINMEPDNLVVEVSKKDLDVALAKALVGAFFNYIVENYIYVVGVSEDKNKATDIARKINEILGCIIIDNKCARVYIPRGSNNKYVTVGALGSKQSAEKTRKLLINIMHKELTVNSDKDILNIATLVSEGRIVPGIALLEK